MKGQRETAIGRAEGRSGACPCTSLGFEGGGRPFHGRVSNGSIASFLRWHGRDTSGL